MLEPQIIYEDNSILVVNKPFGLIVNNSESARALTLQAWLKKNREYHKKISGNKQIEEEFKKRTGIVHRLDRETSGVMVVAKSIKAFKELKQQFKARETRKIYYCLVHGYVEPQKGHIRWPIARNPRNRLRFAVRAKGRMSETFYKVEERYKKENKETDEGKKINKDYTFLKVFPKTGRTHQIRVHLDFIGHTIVSDSLYLSGDKYQEDLNWCPHLFLHAAELTFLHPKKGEKMTFEALMPKQLNQVLKQNLSLTIK